MRRFAVIVTGCFLLYSILALGFLSLTDVGELNKQFPHVKYDFKEKKSSIEIRKERPNSWVPISAISSIAVASIMLSEDWAFYQHNGFDWNQIWDSFQTNIEKGHFARGGSTITQQVVKNIFLSSEKTIWRKVKEAILTVRMERQVPKKRILEIYLNIAEFGEGLYGIGPASEYYFHKPASSLNAKEGVFLAMLLPSPKKYSISFRKKALTKFASSAMRGILSKLLATKRITQEEYDLAIATPLNFEHSAEPIFSKEEVLEEEEADDIPVQEAY